MRFGSVLNDDWRGRIWPRGKETHRVSSDDFCASWDDGKGVS